MIVLAKDGELANLQHPKPFIHLCLVLPVVFLRTRTNKAS